MAALVDRPIVVPPEPGLMGAFGVALEVKKRVETGLLKKKNFDLKTLIDREVIYGKPFICKGGSNKCDRRCEIAVIELEGKKYPFGGACNRYYNLQRNIKYDLEKLDLVNLRQRLIFEKYGVQSPKAVGKEFKGKIGFNKSFMVNTYFPLYSNFFAELGFEPVLPDFPDKEGIDRKNAAFCYPAELAHGFFHKLCYLFSRFSEYKSCSGSQTFFLCYPFNFLKF